MILHHTCRIITTIVIDDLDSKLYLNYYKDFNYTEKNFMLVTLTI